MADYIFFDFDGTLFDTAEGISASVQYAAAAFGRKVEPEDLLRFCGPPVEEIFAGYFGFTREETAEVVRVYRQHYDSIGYLQCAPFPGARELLEKLREDGKKLAVTTSKSQISVDRILEKTGMTDLFDLVCGCGADETRTKKWEVVDYALKYFGIKPDEAVLVGDRKYDVLGAGKCGVKCIGVRFGYAEPMELEQAGAVQIAESFEELYQMLSGK